MFAADMPSLEGLRHATLPRLSKTMTDSKSNLVGLASSAHSTTLPREKPLCRLLLLAALAQLAYCADTLRAAQPSPTQREIVLRSMAQRPGDPWPRGQGHVVLAIPGSQQPEKGYHEPGGSFSPAVGSFGVAIWVREPDGKLKTTSGTLPIAQIRQRLQWPDPKGLPAIVTTTPYYEAAWTYLAAGTVTLQLDRRGDPHARLELAIRSVGSAGGPIEKIAWSDGRLTINDRWTLTVAPEPEAVYVGHEGDADWKSQRPKTKLWKGPDGWGYARIELAPGRTSKITLHDSVPPAANPLHYKAVRATLELELPDPRFADCLNAQVAHLMMGLMDRRTPPGEPTNYPLAWQRDGVAVVAGLARAGQLEVARELMKYFAENDFFGGFGAEGDAPGQGLRVLEDVASRLHDAALDRWLWPHVQRKAALIVKMAAAEKPIRMPYVGPIVPAHRQRNDLDLVCEPTAQNPQGLYQGPHGFRSPGVVYYRRQLPGPPRRCGAGPAIASRRGCRSLAGPGDALAGGLAQGPGVAGAADLYLRAVAHLGRRPEQGRLSRSACPAFRPAAVSALDLFCRGGNPPMGFPRSARPRWKNLDWFLAQQTSPGLYAWWEGNGEENTFHLWEGVRGWVKPPHVTPHYWTAGEMLALLVDMLAYVDESQAEPVLVIGAGVPTSWADKPLRVRGLPTSLGLVDWSWKDGKMQVTVQGTKPKIRLGPAFGAVHRAARKVFAV